MDNLSVHKVKEIKNILQLAGIKVIYLSPYSPEFNPIENCWSKIKAYLRNLAARTRDELEKGLVEALDRVTKTDIRNWGSPLLLLYLVNLKTAVKEYQGAK